MNKMPEDKCPICGSWGLDAWDVVDRETTARVDRKEVCIACMTIFD